MNEHKVKAVPEGMHTVTPHLTIAGCGEAIAFFREAFGAEELQRMTEPSGTKILHAMVRIGDSTLFVNDEFPEQGGVARPFSPWLYVDDCDRAFARRRCGGRREDAAQ